MSLANPPVDVALDVTPDVPHVVLLSHAKTVPQPVLGYAVYLVRRGVRVDLVAMTTPLFPDPVVYPHFRVCEVKTAEERHPVKWLQSTVLYKIPLAVLNLVRRVARHLPGGRPLLRAERLARRIHRRIADAVNLRLFWPVYQHVRPVVLARVSRRALASIDFGSVDRVVVTDTSSERLAWQLACRHPELTVTTERDREPYAHLEPIC